MGKSDTFGVSFSSKLLALCIHKMPVTITHLASLSTSLCGRLGPDLISALIPKRISHEYGRYPDVSVATARLGSAPAGSVRLVSFLGWLQSRVAKSGSLKLAPALSLACYRLERLT